MKIEGLVETYEGRREIRRLADSSGSIRRPIGARDSARRIASPRLRVQSTRCGRNCRHASPRSATRASGRCSSASSPTTATACACGRRRWWCTTRTAAACSSTCCRWRAWPTRSPRSMARPATSCSPARVLHDIGKLHELEYERAAELFARGQPRRAHRARADDGPRGRGGPGDRSATHAHRDRAPGRVAPRVARVRLTGGARCPWRRSFSRPPTTSTRSCTRCSRHWRRRGRRRVHRLPPATSSTGAA